jgi:hypothetical protein
MEWNPKNRHRQTKPQAAAKFGMDGLAAISVFQFQTYTPVIKGKPLVLGMPSCTRCLPTHDQDKISRLAKAAVAALLCEPGVTFHRRQ